jgi:hypothetical protein
VAANIIRTGHIRGLCNTADILTKPLGAIESDRYLHDLLFGRRMRKEGKETKASYPTQ